MSANAPVKDTNYKIPSFITPTGEFARNDSALLEHLSACVESSKAFLRSNRMWRVAEVCRKILYGDDKFLAQFSKDSRVEINKLRRQTREIIGNASNIRPNFDIRTAKSDESASDKAATYEELKQHWWYDQAVDRIFKEGVQEASAGLGYLWIWPKRDPNTRKMEVRVKALSYKEGLPYQLPANGDIDAAYNFTIWCETPLAEFQEEYPAYANSIKQDRNAPSYIGKRFQRAREVGAGIKGILKAKFTNRTDSVIDPSFPTVDVFYTWTRDNTINKTGKTIRMGTLINGDLAGHDSYEVPSFEPGKNTEEECRLFPFRRLTIWTKSHILYDGPPKWITNCVPVAELRFERLPKEFIGVPVTNDGRSLEDTINRLINSIVERIENAARFPIGIDETLPKQVRAKLEKHGLRALVGKALALNFKMQGEPVKALFDRKLFEINSYEFEVVKSLMEVQDYVTGTNDYSNLQRKNQVPAADTQEALTQSLGVLSVDHEREIAVGVMKMGRIWLQLAPQVYTLKKRIMVIGANAVDAKDMDYDPESLVPSSDPRFNEKPYWKRLMEHLEKFNLYAAPGSLQERRSMTNKLTLLQILKVGGRISDEEIYNKFIGDGRFTKITGQWEDEQLKKAVLAARIRMEVEGMMQSAQSPEGGGILQQVLKQLELQNTMNEGRPSSNSAPPQLRQMSDPDGVPRSTVATS